MMEKSMRSNLNMFEYKRHRRVNRLTRSRGENEQGEVSALFQEKRENR